MPEGLKKKLGPLPVWAWVLLGGGTLGVILLTRRAKSKEAEQGVPVPEHAAALPLEGGVGGGGGGGVSPDLERRIGELEGKANAPVQAAVTSAEPSHVTATPVSDYLTTQHELEAGGWHFGQAPSGSTAPAVANSLSAARGGTPGRGGVPFQAGRYKGQAAHIYSRAVPGGVGPGKNVIVLGHVGGRTHAKPGNHAPAHAKPKPAHAHKPAPATHVHGRKPAPHHAAPKRKPAARRKR